MRALRITAFSLLGVLAVALIGTVTAWAVAGRPSAGRVAPHVSLAGKPVGGLTSAQLDQRVDELAAQYSSASIEVRSGDTSFTTPSATVGLQVDAAATRAAVMRVGRNGFVGTNVVNWVRHLFDERATSVKVSTDDTATRKALMSLDTDREPATEPTIKYDTDKKVVAVDGSNGRGLVAEDVDEAIRSAAGEGLPISVTVARSSLEPRFSHDDAEALAAKANGPLPTFDVHAGSASATITNDALRPWLTANTRGTTMQLAIDPAAANNALPALLPNAGTAVVEPTFVVEDNTPKWQPGKDGTACCDTAAGSTLAAATGALLNGGTPLPAAVDLPLSISHPKDMSTESPLPAIKEQVAAFTTNYPAGQPRVINIHKIADTVRGQIIQPGAIFSLNDTVGERTTEKGYVADHAIENSQYVESVGGGISQFSTTLFNAAFFGGLDWTEYQSHTIYINRYPYGREATISFPAPDQKIKNTTPYPILIWTSYTNTSVTVQLYSTKFVNAVQSGQSEQPLKNDCKRVKTDRLRTYLDGHTATDSVYAVYQPREGVNCWAN